MDFIKKLRERRAAIKAELQALLDTAEGESRALTEVEDAEYRTKIDEIGKLDERIAELQEMEAREAAAAQNDREVAAVVSEERAKVTTEPNPVYRADRHEVSFFRDMFNAGRGNTEARDRLVRSQETRAGDMTTSTGAGGEFAPPLWLIDEFVALARPGRVTADVVQNETLPSGISSVNLPTIASGTTTAVQSTQNTALSDTAATTSSVSASVKTIGGKQIVSMQLLQQSGIPFDRVILSDLARSYAVTLDQQVITAISGLSGANAVSVSATGVTASGGVYKGVANAIQTIQGNRYVQPTAVVMHPRRWMALIAEVDSAGRPLVVPDGPAFNQLVSGNNAVAQGRVGTMLGLPVFTDPSIKTNGGAGTNQDEVYVLVAEDLWLYESAVQAASFDATYADQASVLFRVLGYYAFLPNRYPKSVAVLTGAGLVPPTF